MSSSIFDFAQEFFFLCLVGRGVQARKKKKKKNSNLLVKSVRSGVWWLFFLVESSLCVVHLVVVLCGGAAVRGVHVSVDGRGDAAAAVLVVVGQRQAQQAGAGGQVDVLHVLHLRPTHGTQLKGKEEENIEHQVDSFLNHLYMSLFFKSQFMGTNQRLKGGVYRQLGCETRLITSLNL